LFRDYGILAQNLVELGALALLADPAGSKEKRANKRKIVSLVKVSLYFVELSDILNVNQFLACSMVLRNGSREGR
jgi:hypothetical protein